MYKSCVFAALFTLVFAVHGPHASAELSYDVKSASDTLRFIVIKGSFSFDDDLSGFRALVRLHSPFAVAFDSPGGNVYKAMELGRLIRSYRLHAIQPRGPDCSSACALAFFGGITRYAEAGAIGMHRTSFADGSASTDFAVSAVQVVTADLMGYMIEMGVDPTLLQLTLRYDSDDIRYLSKSEMAKFRVTTAATIPTLDTQATAPSKRARRDISLSVPQPRSGRVRHPSGKASLKVRPRADAADITDLSNGTSVVILDGSNRWYQIRVGRKTGYLHSTLVKVDQFENAPFDHRFVQVKSFDNLPEAKAFVRSAPIPLSAHLANNGWIAITLGNSYEKDTALALLKDLKEKGTIPRDSYVTYGNTYVRKICCE